MVYHFLITTGICTPTKESIHEEEKSLKTSLFTLYIDIRKHLKYGRKFNIKSGYRSDHSVSVIG